jgi:hypothetical protein
MRETCFNSASRRGGLIRALGFYLLHKEKIKMKKLILVFCLTTFFSFAGQTAYACTCGNVEGLRVDANANIPTLNPEEAEKWRREQNDHALFTGQVVKIERVKVKRSNERVSMKKVTIRVERYWLGAKLISPEMIIYTGVGGGDCGVPYVKGNHYFFWASRLDGLLETTICSPNKVSDKLVGDMNTVFGNAKEFL